MANILGVKYRNKVGKYLGVDIDFNQSKKSFFEETAEMIHKRLSGWEARLLSQAGRLVLIKYVLQSILVYPMSTFLFPKKYTEKLDSLCINFFWGFKGDKPRLHLLNRNFVHNHKHLGGLGIKNNWTTSIKPS